MRHYEESTVILAESGAVFAFVDDHKSFSSHMNQSSPMMGGGMMNTTVDDKKGQEVGSHIIMEGTALGIHIFLDEVVTERIPPRLKVWKTVGNPNLVIIGHYQMKVEITPDEKGSQLKVSIDYELPQTNAWLGKLFGAWYAKWCVGQMINGAKNYFVTK